MASALVARDARCSGKALSVVSKSATRTTGRGCLVRLPGVKSEKVLVSSQNVMGEIKMARTLKTIGVRTVRRPDGSAAGV